MYLTLFFAGISLLLLFSLYFPLQCFWSVDSTPFFFIHLTHGQKSRCDWRLNGSSTLSTFRLVLSHTNGTRFGCLLWIRRGRHETDSQIWGERKGREADYFFDMEMILLDWYWDYWVVDNGITTTTPQFGCWSQLCYEKFMIRATHNCFFLWIIHSNKTQALLVMVDKKSPLESSSISSSQIGLESLPWIYFFECIRHSTWCVTPFSKSPHVLQSPVFVNWKWLFPKIIFASYSILPFPMNH